MPLGVPSNESPPTTQGGSGGGGGSGASKTGSSITSLVGGTSPGGVNGPPPQLGPDAGKTNELLGILMGNGPTSTFTPHPYLAYLQSALEQQNAYYNTQLGLVESQLGDINAQSGFQIGNVNARADLASQRLDNSLWGVNQSYGILQRDLNNRGARAGDIWSELQRNNRANRGFTGTARDLALRDIGLSFNSSMRSATDDAAARGAYVTPGTRATFGEIGQRRDIDTGGANLSHDRAIEQLVNQFNNGKISYQQALDGINAARERGALDRDMAHRGDATERKGINQNRQSAIDQILYDQTSSQGQLTQQRTGLTDQQNIVVQALSQMIAAGGQG